MKQMIEEEEPGSRFFFLCACRGEVDRTMMIDYDASIGDMPGDRKQRSQRMHLALTDDFDFIEAKDMRHKI